MKTERGPPPRCQYITHAADDQLVANGQNAAGAYSTYPATTMTTPFGTIDHSAKPGATVRSHLNNRLLFDDLRNDPNQNGARIDLKFNTPLENTLTASQPMDHQISNNVGEAQIFDEPHIQSHIDHTSAQKQPDLSN